MTNGLGNFLLLLQGNLYGLFRSEVIPLFWLRVDWLFAEELPDVLDTVLTLLEPPEWG